MWALNLTQCFEGRKNPYTCWKPAQYLEAVWGFYEDLERAPAAYNELLTGTEDELRELLAIKYGVRESNACTRIGIGKDGTLYIPSHGQTQGYCVSQYPVYTGTSWEEALEIATRIPKLLVKEVLIPEEHKPRGTTNATAFNGAYGCERSRAFNYMFLWRDPRRALRILTSRARREAGLVKPRKPPMDFYRLLMECLRSVVAEHAEVFRIPKGLPSTLEFDRLYVKVVAKRAVFKDDPAAVMAWIAGCHRMFRLMDRRAFARLGRSRQRYQWHNPPMAYRQAVYTLVRNAPAMKETVRKYFKIGVTWRWFFAWVAAEHKRLAGRTASNASDQGLKLAA